jgi:hypothetical protein
VYDVRDESSHEADAELAVLGGDGWAEGDGHRVEAEAIRRALVRAAHDLAEPDRAADGRGDPTRGEITSSATVSTARQQIIRRALGATCQRRAHHLIGRRALDGRLEGTVNGAVVVGEDHRPRVPIFANSIERMTFAAAMTSGGFA